MNDSALIIANFPVMENKNNQQIDSQSFDIKKLWKTVKTAPDPLQYILYADDPKSVVKQVCRELTCIHAAGGFVKNGDGEFLFIYRLGKWDLPKGKMDEGEKPKETAVREVEEECGIIIDYLGPKIMSTYHLYDMRGKPVIKKTRWYEMAVNGMPKLLPQLSEDITKAIWLDTRKFPTVFANTYPLIKDVIVNYYDRPALEI